jgi:hypothetical protein
MRPLVIPTTGMVKVLAGVALAACLALLAGVPVRHVAVLAGAVLLPGWPARARPLAQPAPVAAGAAAHRAHAARRFFAGRADRAHAGAGQRRAAGLAVTVFDEVDPRFAFEGLPQSLTVPPASRAELRYTVTARERGVALFGTHPAALAQPRRLL